MVNYTSAQKNAVAQVARSAMGGGSGFKKVAGLTYMQDVPIAARPKLPKNDANAIKQKTKYTIGNLSYPLNVGDDPQQGHHIIFEVDVVNKGQIEANKVERRRQAFFKNAGLGGFDGIAPGQAIDKLPAADTKDAAKNAKGGKKMRSLTYKKVPTVRAEGFIALYMPANIKVQYAAEYGEEEIGLMAEGGSAIIDAFMQGKGTKDTAMNALNQAATGVKQMAVQALDAVAPGAKHVMALHSGKVTTPRMELMFKGIGRREFSFEFSFLPKSEPEAIVVEEIIHKFKYHMASNFSTGGEGVRKMDIPDHFRIKYMYHNRENTHLNKISTCVLKGLDVDYGGDRFVAYGDGRPQATKIGLTFQELEIITKDDIEIGY
jgi:hypothetical protein